MKCVSSCFSCLCGVRRNSRITPAEPVQIIQANQGKYRVSQDGEQYVDDEEESAGSTNPNFFLDDEGGGDPVIHVHENGGESILKQSTSSKTLHVKAFFIEVGKDRLLRVIHIPSKDELEKGSLPGKAGTSSPDKSNGDISEKENSQQPSENKESSKEAEHGEDDEEEYWFTKWARKPRFRSIFAKNPDQRPKISSESNNNNSVSQENNRASGEAELARAAAAAKRRAWAYNNNGNSEPAITQQPTINPNDEEEFSSIAIVNSNKQQWMKGAKSNDGIDSEDSRSPSSSPGPKASPTLEVEVAVEIQNGRAERVRQGVSNPAFQHDEDDDIDQNQSEEISDEAKVKEQSSPKNKTDGEQNTSVLSASSSGGNATTASLKSSLSPPTSPEEEDAITTETNEEACSTPGASSATDSFKAPPDNLVLNPLASRKPLLFFIHSISGSSDVWKKQMEFFQQLGYEIVAPDLLGHGLSSTPLNPKYYYFESLVQDLILIFDHFTKEDMKVVLIGHGYGACLATMLTRVRLKNIALLITIAGGGPTPLVRRTCCQDSWFSWKCKLFHSNRVRGRFDNPELKHVLPPSIYRNVLSGQVWGDGDSAFYRRVTVPTLLVYGMRDKVVTLVEECEMERTIPKSFLELIDSAGHMVMLDEPEKLNKMLCKFIQSWS